MTTAEKCKLLRRKLNYSQRKFGEIIGCSQPMVSLIENGWTGVETIFIEKIDTLYEFSLAFCAVYSALKFVNKTPKGKGENI